jgi:hypothetical protein
MVKYVFYIIFEKCSVVFNVLNFNLYVVFMMFDCVFGSKNTKPKARIYIIERIWISWDLT